MPESLDPIESAYENALAQGPARGRGAGLNPANRFQDLSLHVLGETLDAAIEDGSYESQVPTNVIPDATKSIINPVDSPDLGLKWTVNPYRGCEHGCIYCYARPTHENLGYSCGLDFETQIVAKHDAPTLLRKELSRPGWKAEPISLSGVTDCYQPVEQRLQITRRCLEVFAECRQPIGIVTKSALILRDLDLLTELAAHKAACVYISVTSLDNRLASQLEPRAAAPQRRLEVISQLSEAGIPVGVMVAPIIPGITDRETASILKEARDHGATNAGYMVLRLPYQLKELFLDWLLRAMPDRASHVESLIRQVRGGELYDNRFGKRMRGEGPIAEQIGRVFRVFARRYGLNKTPLPMSQNNFRAPIEDERGQRSLF